MSVLPPDGDSCRVLAFVCADEDSLRWAATITTLLAAGSAVHILAGRHVDTAQRAYRHLIVEVSNLTLSEAVGQAMEQHWAGIFVAHSPVALPGHAFDRALGILDADIRVATVSFLSNDANYLSFPVRNTPSGMTIDGHNEASITTHLRSVDLVREATPIPVPAGGGVLLATIALRAVGGIDSQCPSPEVAILDFALRAVRRGFRHVLDASTFVMRPLPKGERPDPLSDPVSRNWLNYRHQYFPRLYDEECDSRTSPLANALTVSAAAVRGLKILIDGSCLGPYEMGTQVQTLSLVSSLCARDDVREVIVALNDQAGPDYARQVLSDPKVRICQSAALTFPDAPYVDIIHRPFQPDEPIPWHRWKHLARRIVVTVQDLIAYDNGDYHREADSWIAYREAIWQGVGRSDGLVVISEDVATAVRQAQLPYSEERLFVAEMGTDHPLAERYGEKLPIEILETGREATDFILVLGASYAHKNRDLAIRVWHELRARGHNIALVLAGVVVPTGSSRNDEALASSKGEWPITLADVTSAERNWLMRHASVVLYPTSAEGFGLVPFEAATFGTPTVFVGFGPLADLLGSAPLAAAEWEPSVLADAIGRLLSDPDLGRAQVEAVLKIGERFTWETTADKLVAVYMRLLAKQSLLA